ncbi:hypothetical protein [uncultured Aquimarina sp.]|uniref:hypothetical protein n=1 Tax=uncultured Aquimarina sp. TaxID=575652 RepID=UPI002613F47D|nr:hypothetical protein [uncultured Aquimarina sp.]
MKAIKTIFAVLFVSSMFIACEADTISEEVGIDEADTLEMKSGEQGDEEEVEYGS